MTAHLYVLIDPSTTRVRYIGYTTSKINQRLNGHINAAKSGRASHRCNWIRSLLKRSLKPEIHLVDSYQTVEEAKQAEIQMIAELRNEGWDLVNTTSGGDSGSRHTEESKKKIAERHKTRSRNSYWFCLNRPSPIQVAKMSAAKKGKPNPKKCRLVQDQFGFIYPSIKIAAQVTAVSTSSIHASLKGTRHPKGYTFSYV